MEPQEWRVDERAAARAFLQRSEVRLSTIHRVATALLSGAGLMVLLPAIARDAVTSVLAALVDATPSAAHYLLGIATALALAVPVVAFLWLLRDLTAFYFHAQHLDVGGLSVFTPRFTLTGLRMPSDELGPSAAAELAASRRDPATVELLVPPNDGARARIDHQLDAYGGLGRQAQPGDEGRAAGLLALVAARDRPLAEEVAKVEHGMARHLLRVQVIVLRYVKALVLFLVTALVVFAAAGVVDSDRVVGPSTELALAAVYLAWAPVVVVAVGWPVRTLEALLRAEGAASTALAADDQLTAVERVAVTLATLGWLAALGALAASVIGHRPDGRALALAVTAAGGGTAAMAASLVAWRRRRRPR